MNDVNLCEPSHITAANALNSRHRPSIQICGELFRINWHRRRLRRRMYHRADNIVIWSVNTVVDRWRRRGASDDRRTGPRKQKQPHSVKTPWASVRPTVGLGQQSPTFSQLGVGHDFACKLKAVQCGPVSFQCRSGILWQIICVICPLNLTVFGRQFLCTR